MKYPPRRDRLATYIASWSNSLKLEDRILLAPLVLTHDCVSKKADLKANIYVTKNYHLAAEILAPFKSSLSALGLAVDSAAVDRASGTGQLIFGISVVGGAELKFDSAFEVVAFINRIAIALNHPPVLALEKHITKREVLVKFMSDKRRWIDEAYWLAVWTALSPESMASRERCFADAFLALRREGDVIRLTLYPTLDAKTATILEGTNGVAFHISVQDRNLLRAVGQTGYVPQVLTILLEFRSLPASGVRQLSRILAPHILNAEFVSAEASHG